MSDGVRCMLMRGGTSKGAYFLAEDLPSDPAERNDLLLRIMGSRCPAIDGIGGAHPLTSKVAVMSRSVRADADVDYLFLQVGVGGTQSRPRQPAATCWPASPVLVERGLADKTTVRIHMVNSGSVATATFPGADGVVDYTAAPRSPGCRGRPRRWSSTSPELRARPPAPCCHGNVRHRLEGIGVACIDNGMPAWSWPRLTLAAPPTRASPISRRTSRSAKRFRRCGSRPAQRWGSATYRCLGCRSNRSSSARRDGRIDTATASFHSGASP